MRNRYNFILCLALCIAFLITACATTTTRSRHDRKTAASSEIRAQKRESGEKAREDRLVKHAAFLDEYVLNNPDWKNEAWGLRADARKKLGDDGPQLALDSYNNGVKARQERRYRTAIEYYERGMEFDPAFPWSANNLAWLLATCPDTSVRNGPAAIRYANMAIANTKIDVADFMGTLAAAYAANGQFMQATLLCQDAYMIYPTQERKEMLTLFQSRKPYIDTGDTPNKQEHISSEGFGETRWGITKMQVISLYPKVKIKHNDLLVSDHEVFAGKDVRLEFYFFYDMLFRVDVDFHPDRLDKSNRQVAEDYLFKEYGRVDYSSSETESGKIHQWLRDDTVIEYEVSEILGSSRGTYVSRTIDRILQEKARAEKLYGPHR
jgi:tetratricopeptide (TPR) repeat protein